MEILLSTVNSAMHITSMLLCL